MTLTKSIGRGASMSQAREEYIRAHGIGGDLDAIARLDDAISKGWEAATGLNLVKAAHVADLVLAEEAKEALERLHNAIAEGGEEAENAETDKPDKSSQTRLPLDLGLCMEHGRKWELSSQVNSFRVGQTRYHYMMQGPTSYSCTEDDFHCMGCGVDMVTDPGLSQHQVEDNCRPQTHYHINDDPRAVTFHKPNWRTYVTWYGEDTGPGFGPAMLVQAIEESRHGEVSVYACTGYTDDTGHCCYKKVR